MIRVLVLGGHEWERALLRHVLHNFGFEVPVVDNGTGAVAVHIRQSCHLLILNGCPYSDDIRQAVMAIRSHTPSVKIISLLDGSSHPGTIRAAIEQIGEHPILLKPFRIEPLWHLLLALPYDGSITGQPAGPLGSGGLPSSHHPIVP